MVDWSQYKNEIIALDQEGLSSTDIARVLSKKHAEIDETRDRAVRKVLQRARERGEYEVKQQPAKILLFDIETAPMIAYLWSLRQKYITPDKIKQDWFVICWSAKWLFDDEIMSECVTPEEARTQNDKRIVEDLWKLLDEADIVIGHNSDNFDIKKMNGRFIKYGLNLPSPFRSIDTYKAARKRLNLSSLKLGFIAEYLGVSEKQDTNFQMWVDCLAGNQDQLNKMARYCDQDVKVLEDVYLQLRPFIQPHPPIGFNIETDISHCPACGSDDLKQEGTYTTNVNQYDAYRCKSCGSISRSRKSNITGKQREGILSPTPR